LSGTYLPWLRAPVAGANHDQLPPAPRSSSGPDIHSRDLETDLATKEVYQGALIAEIASGSPAEKAGLQKGDIVKALCEIICRCPPL